MIVITVDNVLGPTVTCGRCGCLIAPTTSHVCFTDYWVLPIRLCSCGRPAEVAHFCTFSTVPILQYPSGL
jgi:hypothetical protein